MIPFRVNDNKIDGQKMTTKMTTDFEKFYPKFLFFGNPAGAF